MSDANFLTDEIKDQIRRLATKYNPQEMCGLILADSDGVITYRDIANTHEDKNNHFRIHIREVEKVESEGKAILAIVHSHPKGSSDASANDKVQMNIHQRPYVIVGMDGDIQVHEPKRAPLVGRQYVHGSQDCYGIVRDYYARELGINLPDIQREDRWWEDKSHPSLYLDNFKDFGFVAVSKDDLQRHDVLLCRWEHATHVNHALIYLGDDPTLKSEETPPCIGARMCLHHPYGGLSGRFLLGETRLNSTEAVVRHRSLVK